MTPRIDTKWSMGPILALRQPTILFYPLIRNQPFTRKGVPTAYANGARLTGQADDNLVPRGNRFGRLSSGHRSLPVSNAGEQTVFGEATPVCRYPLSLLGRPVSSLRAQFSTT
jgi:hypothetical protein